MSVAVFDIVAFVVLAYGAFKGFRSGLILSASYLVSVALGMMFGLVLVAKATEAIANNWPNTSAFARPIAFVLVFGGIFFVVNLIANFLRNAIGKTPFGLLDSWLGAFFGIVKFSLYISLLLFFLDFIQYPIPEKYLGNSFLFPLLKQLFPSIFGSFFNAANGVNKNLLFT